GSNTGLSFLGPFGAGPGQTLDAFIKFVIMAPSITSEALAMDGFAARGNGTVQVVESMCLGAAQAIGAPCTGSGGTKTLSVFADSTSSRSFDSVAFPAVSTIDVTKNIIVNGGSTGTSSNAGVSIIVNEIPGGGGGGPGSVPEPDTLVMLGSGLVVTALFLKRR